MFVEISPDFLPNRHLPLLTLIEDSTAKCNFMNNKIVFYVSVHLFSPFKFQNRLCSGHLGIKIILNICAEFRFSPFKNCCLTGTKKFLMIPMAYVWIRGGYCTPSVRPSVRLQQPRLGSLESNYKRDCIASAFSTTQLRVVVRQVQRQASLATLAWRALS